FIAFDKKNNRYLLTSELEQIIYSVNNVSGMRDIFTGGGVGDGDSFSPLGVAGVAGMAIDNTNQRVIVSEHYSGQMFSVDMETRDRTLITSPTSPDDDNVMKAVQGIAISHPNGYAYVCDEIPDAIFAVDLVTGYRVYV